MAVQAKRTSVISSPVAILVMRLRCSSRSEVMLRVSEYDVVGVQRKQLMNVVSGIVVVCG